MDKGFDSHLRDETYHFLSFIDQLFVSLPDIDAFYYQREESDKQG